MSSRRLPQSAAARIDSSVGWLPINDLAALFRKDRPIADAEQRDSRRRARGVVIDLHRRPQHPPARNRRGASRLLKREAARFGRVRNQDLRQQLARLNRGRKQSCEESRRGNVGERPCGCSHRTRHPRQASPRAARRPDRHAQGFRPWCRGSESPDERYAASPRPRAGRARLSARFSPVRFAVSCHPGPRQRLV